MTNALTQALAEHMDAGPQSAQPQALRERILLMLGKGQRMSLCGHGSKAFYGRQTLLETTPVSSLDWAGIVSYEPTELVITARAGTPLVELEDVLAQHGQMLASETPRFGSRGTLGGAVAAGLSGPRRPYAGALRDFVLGLQLIDGRGSVMRFGGRVIKNVAGFDVARLMVGAMGTLGQITEVTLKTQPLPACSLTLVQQADAATALHRFGQWRSQPLPITATAHWNGLLYVRLCGAPVAVQAARQQIGGDEMPQASLLWEALRDQTHAFFQAAGPLWRLSLPATTPELALPLPQLIEWGGAQRWLIGELDNGTAGNDGASALAARARRLGGHLTCFRSPQRSAVIDTFSALPPALYALHQRVKHTFDPSALFNPGRLYAGL